MFPTRTGLPLVLSLVAHQKRTMQLLVRLLLVLSVVSSVPVVGEGHLTNSVGNGSCPRKFSYWQDYEGLRYLVPLFAEPTQFAKHPGLVVEIWAQGTQVELDVFSKQSPEDCVTGEKILLSHRPSGEDHMRFHHLSGPGVCRGAKRPPVNQINLSMIYGETSYFYIFWRTCVAGGYKLSAVLVDCRWRWSFRQAFSEDKWRSLVEENLLPNDTL